MTTTWPSAVVWTSSSMWRAPRASARSKAARGVSGALDEAPRWAMTRNGRVVNAPPPPPRPTVRGGGRARAPARASGGGRARPPECPARRGLGPWLENHRLALGRQEPEQRPNGEGMSHEHERARATPRGHDLLQLL